MPTALAPDLWPTDLLSPPLAPTPIAVLKQQGKALGARTHNFVYGEVETEPNPQGTTFAHKLVLVAPFIRYRRPLLYVNHGLHPYPATVVETDLTKPANQGYELGEVKTDASDKSRFSAKLSSKSPWFWGFVTSETDFCRRRQN